MNAARALKYGGIASALFVAASCSKSKGEPDAASGGASARAGSEASNKAGSLSIGGSLNRDPSDVAGASGDDGVTRDAVTRDDACATATDATEPVPPVVQLVVDSSGSMDWPPGWAPASPDDSKPPGATKWEITRQALLDAVAELPSDLALGASFYPSVEQEGDTCLANEEAVPIALLGSDGSEARQAWADAVTQIVPVGATPTHGAYLFGLEQLAKTKLSGERVLLLITDGTPTCNLSCECTEDNVPVDSQPLIAEATQAFENGVRTFVIGSPGSEDTRDVLSRLASVGGTARESCSDTGPSYCHFDMTTEPDFAQALAKALVEIGKSLHSCEYPLPKPPAGKALDPSLVNVLYTPGGGNSETIARAASNSDCSEGWQYSADGKNIVLCGDACERVRSEPNSTVEVLFGCKTVVQKPK